MASSMTMPTASVSASIVIEFRVKPAMFMMANVEMMLTGIETAEMIVERQFARNRNTTTAARIEPRKRCSFTAPIALPMNSD